MIHNFLLIMSLSGSVVLLLYLLTYPVARRYFSLAWRYCILKMAAVFYLVPFPLCLLKIRVFLLEAIPWPADRFLSSAFFLNTDYVIYYEGDSVYTSRKMKGMFILLIGFALFTLMTIIMHIRRYWKERKTCLKYSDLPVEQEWKELFYKIKGELNIKRNVRFYCSEYCKSPITLGVLFPVIVIPPWVEEEVGRSLCQDMVRHELVHVKHRDLQMRFLALLVIAVHWFNPFAYVLYYEISNISEMYCDSIVLKGKEEKARKEYGELLLKLAVKKQAAKSDFVLGIMGGNGKRAFKRRILEMKTTRKNKTALSVVVMALICMMGGFTVCAYDAPIYITSQEETDYQEEGFDFQFTVGGDEIEEAPYEKFFIDDAGNVYQIEEEGYDSRVSCSHKYVAGTCKLHSKKSNGGCTITTYEAKRCSKCGNMIQGEEISTLTYKKCPH